MKHITIKSALMRFIAVFLLILGSVSASAQYYMNIRKDDGTRIQYVITSIDSVWFTGFTPEYVDLGLSVKWATFNVGASNPEEYGDYYAWGETELKSTYDLINYKWYYGESLIIKKYNTDSNYGTIDNDTIVELEDDVAHIMWGGNWRMPTMLEWEELVNNCSWSLYRTGNTEFGGVPGYKVTSKKSGYTDRFIFLPFAGFRDTSLEYAGSDGTYWSSSLNTNNSRSAWNLILNSGGVSVNNAFLNSRNLGLSVRPVYSGVMQDNPEPNNITSITIDSTNLLLKIGEEYALKATAWNGNKVDNAATITWKTDKESVVTVSSAGLIKGLSVGTATITATCGDISVICSVTVKPIPDQNEASYGNLTLYKANADSTDVTSFTIEARLKGLSTLEDGSYVVYFYYSDTLNHLFELNNGIKVRAYMKGDSIASYAFNNMNMCSTYYFCIAVATFEGDIYYGPVNSYNVKDLVTKGEKIDLGIPGIKFASCNLGATQPEQSGDRYAWGETQTKTSFNLENYLYYNAIVDIWKGLGDDINGTQYDAVTAVLGEGWHMPKECEMSMLSSLCRVKDISYNGINGYLVIGYNGNAIFLPSGYYWTSSYSFNNEQQAKSWENGIKENYRYYGYMIRPIFGELEYLMEYVDLGLSVKWATCNVGATKPEEYGYYFAWGEIEPKTDFSWSTYKWCKGSSNTITKYCSNSRYGNNGFTDTKTTLDSEDDVAHVQWGGRWRMPTKAEQDDLHKKCTWTWYSSGNTEFNGVAGYKVISNIEGYTDRFIFLPAAGYRYSTSLIAVGDHGNHGYYWSNMLNTEDSYGAFYLNFYDNYHGSYSYGNRYLGQSVRPVCE